MRAARGGVVALALYCGIMRALSPAVLRSRAKRGKEDAARLSERMGVPSRARPEGTLIWIHGASVGESLAALPLVSALLEKPNRHVLVTTGTVTSAQLMAERLPPRAFHQYVPIDSRERVRRFLAHWRPDLALFVESELWPNLILETRARGVPMALVNARLSAQSFRGWGYAPRLARRILSCFDACLAQDAEIATGSSRSARRTCGYPEASKPMRRLCRWTRERLRPFAQPWARGPFFLQRVPTPARMCWSCRQRIPCLGLAPMC